MEIFYYRENIIVLIKLGSLESVKEVCIVSLHHLRSLFHMEISPIELWHRRYGHLHYKVIPNFKHLVHGIPNIKEDREGVCKGCYLGKHTIKPFSNSETRSKELLDLIHSNVCGPMSDKSLGGHIYYVTFIDDHSRKTWFYLLKKNEVFDKFKEFRCEVETLTERKIKTLRCDNGWEYNSKELIAYCKDEGIKRELIVPYYPEQNGVAEINNRTTKEGVRTMLLDQDLPNFLWGEGTMTVVYVENRSRHRIINNMKHEEAFTGKKPSMDHFRIFGSPAYIHVPKDKRKNLDSKSIKGIFVGYSLSSKAYRIFIFDGIKPTKDRRIFQLILMKKMLTLRFSLSS